MNRHKPRERLLFGCLLVAFIIGIVAVKLWIVSVEERLAVNIELHRMSVGTDNDLINILETHERRLRKVERASWVVWDGWPTQQKIAQGER